MRRPATGTGAELLVELDLADHTEVERGVDRPMAARGVWHVTAS